VLECYMIGAGPCHAPLSFLHPSESLHTVHLNPKSPGHTLFTNLKRRIVVVDELTPYWGHHLRSDRRRYAKTRSQRRAEADSQHKVTHLRTSSGQEAKTRHPEH